MTEDQDWYARSFVAMDFEAAKDEFDQMKAERDYLLGLVVNSLPELVQVVLGGYNGGYKGLNALQGEVSRQARLNRESKGNGRCSA